MVVRRHVAANRVPVVDQPVAVRARAIAVLLPAAVKALAARAIADAAAAVADVVVDARARVIAVPQPVVAKVPAAQATVVAATSVADVDLEVVRRSNAAMGSCQPHTAVSGLRCAAPVATVSRVPMFQIQHIVIAIRRFAARDAAATMSAVVATDPCSTTC